MLGIFDGMLEMFKAHSNFQTCIYGILNRFGSFPDSFGPRFEVLNVTYGPAMGMILKMMQTAGHVLRHQFEYVF